MSNNNDKPLQQESVSMLDLPKANPHALYEALSRRVLDSPIVMIKQALEAYGREAVEKYRIDCLNAGQKVEKERTPIYDGPACIYNSDEFGFCVASVDVNFDAALAPHAETLKRHRVVIYSLDKEEGA